MNKECRCDLNETRILGLERQVAALKNFIEAKGILLKLDEEKIEVPKYQSFSKSIAISKSEWIGEEKEKEIVEEFEKVSRCRRSYYDDVDRKEGRRG